MRQTLSAAARYVVERARDAQWNAGEHVAGERLAHESSAAAAVVGAEIASDALDAQLRHVGLSEAATPTHRAVEGGGGGRYKIWPR